VAGAGVEAAHDGVRRRDCPRRRRLPSPTRLWRPPPRLLTTAVGCRHPRDVAAVAHKASAPAVDRTWLTQATTASAAETAHDGWRRRRGCSRRRPPPRLLTTAAAAVTHAAWASAAETAHDGDDACGSRQHVCQAHKASPQSVPFCSTSGASPCTPTRLLQHVWEAHHAAVAPPRGPQSFSSSSHAHGGARGGGVGSAAPTLLTTATALDCWSVLLTLLTTATALDCWSVLHACEAWWPEGRWGPSAKMIRRKFGFRSVVPFFVPTEEYARRFDHPRPPLLRCLKW
jgi:hypothetical protein